MQTLASFLEREAGQVAVALALIGAGVAANCCGLADGRELMLFGFGLLGRSQGTTLKRKVLGEK